MGDQYRVRFHLGSHVYYTEWFDSFKEAGDFSLHARRAGLHVSFIENRDHEVV